MALTCMKLSGWSRVDTTLECFTKQNTVSLYFSMLYLIGTVVTQVLTCTDLLMHGAGPYVVKTHTPLGVCLREYRNYLTRVLMAKSKPAQRVIMLGTAYGRPKMEHFKRNKKLNQIRHVEPTRNQPKWLV